MNILLIDCKRKRYSENRYLHLGLFDYMQRDHSIFRLANHKFDAFSWNKEIDPDNFEHQVHSIIKNKNIDFVLVYNSGKEMTGLYLNCVDILSRLDIPKFYVGTDYFRFEFSEKEAALIKKAGFHQVFFRHKASLRFGLSCPSVWLPYSVDIEKFDRYSIDDFRNKNKLVGFLGASKYLGVQKGESLTPKQAKKIEKESQFRNELYSQRINALEALEHKGLINTTRYNPGTRQRTKFGYDDYITFLSSNWFGLTCGGTCNFFVAKYVEIPAAYSMLVCSKTDGLEIFDRNLYIEYDVKNLSKMIKEVEYHIQNQRETEDKILKMRGIIENEHTHSQRADYLIKEVSRYL